MTAPEVERLDPPLIEALAHSSEFVGALDEFASIAALIARTRAEIAVLAPGEIKGAALRLVGGELDAIVRDAERATHEIMNAAEAIAAQSDAPGVQAEASKIFEACAFQDITGQRAAKVIKTLAEIERRVGRFAEAMGIAPDCGADAESGPGLHGPRATQAEVDRILRSA